MRRHCEVVIVAALGRLQNGCCGNLYRTWVIGYWTSRRSGSRVRKSTPLTAVAFSSVATGAVRPHRSEVSTVRALMDLALPRFADLGDRSMRPHRS